MHAFSVKCMAVDGNMKNYRIRVMTAEELATAVDWAAAEGWNPGHNDAACYRLADPEGVLVGLVDDAPVASISVVRYDQYFGFLGFYIVRPEYRGRGLGLGLWQAGLEYLSGCTVGLDGVVAQQDNYRASGFELAYRNVRYRGAGVAACQDGRVVDLANLPFDIVDGYDRPLFPAPRAAFVRAWIAQPGVRARGIVDNASLAGYGVLRPCREGYKIGPLYADTPELADILYRDLAAAAEPGAPVYLDVPEPNPEGLALAARYRMQAVFETARMYRGEAPDLPLRRVFGVTSFEIG